MKKKKIDYQWFLQDEAKISNVTQGNFLNLRKINHGKVFIDLLFEFPEMVTLEYFIVKANNLDCEYVRFVTYKLLKAIEFLHSKNMIHGSIRPDDIFLYKNGKIKIIDFGIHKYLKDQF